MSENPAVQPGADNTPADSPGDARARREMIVLWACILAGPILWFIHQQAGWVLVPWICAYGGVAWLHAITLAAIAAAGVSARVSWRHVRTSGGLEPGTEAAAQRAGFMAWLGVCGSLFFALVILAQGIPVLFLDPCFR